MASSVFEIFSSYPVLAWSLTGALTGVLVVLLIFATVLAITWKVLRDLVGKRVGSAYKNPVDFGLAFEDFSCITEDGIDIAGWYIPHEKADATILMLNGDRSRRDSLLGHARMFHDAGYACATFDYRHRGASGDDAITYGAREKYDVTAVAEYLQDSGLIEGKFVIFGISMGASAALLAAPDLKGVDGYLLNGPYAEFDIVFRQNIEIMGFPHFPFYHFARPLFKLKTGVGVKEMRPVDYAAELGAPVLVIQAGHDIIMRPKNGEMIFNSAREPKEYAYFPDAEHIVIGEEVDNIQNPIYVETVLGFIDKVVNGTTPNE